MPSLATACEVMTWQEGKTGGGTAARWRQQWCGPVLPGDWRYKPSNYHLLISLLRATKRIGNSDALPASHPNTQLAGWKPERQSKTSINIILSVKAHTHTHFLEMWNSVLTSICNIWVNFSRWPTCQVIACPHWLHEESFDRRATLCPDIRVELHK